MWPMLLNMTRDECRRTLRRLELEAYSNMISVFRAQGALEDNRKKLLEELRAVLHISNDRHSAEARRVSNDELLATIAEQLAGPNTGLGWITEGRRLIPLMPRGIAQTMYTEIADKAAEAAAAENREIKNRIETEKLIAPKSNEEEMPDHEGQTAEGSQSNEIMDEMSYPPIAMEDNTARIWETELICRKRKIAEGGTLPDDSSTPVKNMRNIPLNTNQKHLNLSQVYSRYSQPATSKSSGHSKHSYNQVSKVSTSKSSQPHAARSIKHRSHKQSSKSTTQASLKAQRKTQEQSMSPSRQYNSGQQADYSGPPGSFQASYAQSILGSKTKTDYLDEIKPKVLSSPSMVSDSPTMQLLTQPATVPHELAVSDSAHPDDPSSLQAQATPVTKHSVSGKPCQLIIKKRGEVATDKKVQMSEFKVIQKPTDEVKFLSNRQMVVSPSPAHKSINASSKIVTTKVIGSLPKSRTSHTPVLQSDKMIVVSKSSIENRLTNSKVIINSSVNATPTKDSIHSIANSIANKTTETLTPKGIPATDLKVSAKTFVVNPKSGQKMVVLPAKACKEGQLPLFHFKGIPTNMKLVSVSSHNSQATKSPAINVLSNPTVVSAIPSSAKIVGVEPIKTANMADIVPVKGLTPPISTSKISNPIIRPMNTKGNIIVVQKGATLGKTLTFTKNGNDVSKIIMGKNVNKLLQTTKSDQVDASKSGNVIVLELNNEQTGRTTTMSEILCSRNSNAACTPEKDPNIDQEITQETPVLFENQITPEICNTSSLDSSTSLQEIDRLDQSTVGIIEKSEKEKSDFIKDTDGVKETSSVTDWEMELDTTPGKSKDDVDKLNSLHLDLGMSSDSENEYMVDSHEAKTQHLAAERMQTETPTDESLMAGDDEFPSEGKREARQGDVLDDQLSRLLGEDSANSTDSQTVSESLPIDKNEQ
ncbi:BRCA2-interacting transcriptional repressor EMSY isoform X2 [Vanessa tameamea]|uniref:BRCA2-interacting transcriptional repressor EMSY isoform X2 n=1 Tax=Vanessa tameamea TaxID=334116 RepID=A0A8B8ITB7_VANTA|nr:BRCA2-interacting transcriptional repressor EMSY isoform X2 [Vanessa tameamea]